jgi:hypothetical protein
MSVMESEPLEPVEGFPVGAMIEHRLLHFPMEVEAIRPCETDCAHPEPHPKYRVTDFTCEIDWLCHYDVQSPGDNLPWGGMAES